MVEAAPVDNCPLPLSKDRALTLNSHQPYSFQMGEEREDELYPLCTEWRHLSSAEDRGQ